MKTYKNVLLKLGLLSPLEKPRRTILLSLLTIALLAPLISNPLPWYVSLGGNNHFPILNPGGYVIQHEDTIWFRTIDFRIWDADCKLMAPVPYGSHTLDRLENAGKSPFEEQYLVSPSGETRPMPWRYRHWLGTTRTGKDVLAILIHGTSTAFLVGSISMLLAMMLGIGIGFLAGYFGNDRFSLQAGSLLWFFIALPLFLFQLNVCIDAPAEIVGWTILIITPLFLRWLFTRSMELLPLFRRQSTLPVDDMVTSMTSGFTALPQLVLTLSIMVITGPSLFGVILCIGLTSWPITARAVRIESLRLRREAFIESAQANGFTPIRIALGHYLPNLKETLWVTFTTGFASSILMEAGLTFLGAGLPADTASWGGLMAEARNDIRSWWLVVFPGTALTLLTRALTSRKSPSR